MSRCLGDRQAPHIPDLTEQDRSHILADLLALLTTGDHSDTCCCYFASRGILPETIRAFGVRFVNPDTQRAVMKHLALHHCVEKMIAAGIVHIQDGKPRDVFASWYRAKQSFLLFPYQVADHYVSLKGRVLLAKEEAERLNVPRYLNVVGKMALYNINALQGHHKPVYVCEGEIDTMTMAQAGYCAVGIPGAQSFKREWCTLFAGHQVYLAQDGDKAGAEGARHVSRMFANAGLLPPSILPIPQGHDINSLLLRLS
jgi:DNA primase